MYKLLITLKSDICIGSGFSYAGIIDNDSTFDKNGLPYIPARRIKGCLRDSVKLVGCPKNIEDIIFGVSGSDSSNSIIIDNAYLPYHDELANNINDIDQKYVKYLDTQNVLGQYSCVKAQTAVGEDGIAKDGSLRFIRTINHYDPVTSKETVFEAKISFEAIEGYIKDKELLKEVKEYFEKLVKATRNMGMNRNRGLGSVKLSLIEDKEGYNADQEELNNDNLYGFEYVITNKAPLILSDIDDSSTATYIKGSNVLAALVKEYLKEGNSTESDEFRELFLSGNVKYTNAYKAEYVHGRSYRSTPAYLNVNKLKKTKKLVDLSNTYNPGKDGKDYDMSNGNQAKKLRNKNIVSIDGKYKVVESYTEIVYHHSHSGINSKGDNGLLYYLDALEKGQYFKGAVYGTYNQLVKVKKLLESARLSFGKSKGAQYGACELVEGSIKPIYNKEVKFNKGDIIQVKLLSDAMIMDDEGCYTSVSDKAKEIIAKQLGIVEDKDDNTMSFLKTTVITGYLGVWNLQKAQVAGFIAGSVFSYKLAEDIVINTNFIGERNIDGYGEILVEKKHNSFKLDEYIDSYQLNVKPNNMSKKIINDVLLRNIYLTLVKKNQDNTRIKITASSLGRLTLMLVESSNEASTPEKALEKLVERINSIKNPNKKKEVYSFIRKVFNSKVDEEEKSLARYEIVKGMTEGVADYKLLSDLVGTKEAEKMVFAMWAEYLLEVLTYQKYSKKGIEEDEKNILSN